MPEPDSNTTAPAPDADDARIRKLQNRFDIRRIIGGLFALYALILIVVGVVGSDEVKNKADGINVNLWVGLCLLAFGVAMFAWALWRPVVPVERSRD
ncbi:MAG TPA: hypothetical protein VIL49_18235 [Capillimicrobium sp.]|jgi:hypothetical protein